MFPPVPPRFFSSEETRNETLSIWILSGRICSLKKPGKRMIWSNANDPVTITLTYLPISSRYDAPHRRANHTKNPATRKASRGKVFEKPLLSSLSHAHRNTHRLSELAPLHSETSPAG